MNSLDSADSDFALIIGGRGARDKFPVHSVLLLLEDESTHLSGYERLALRLTNEVLEKTLLNVHGSDRDGGGYKDFKLILLMAQINLLKRH